jgi:anaerobic ribonucleoside-triphosphate reductase activating protein
MRYAAIDKNDMSAAPGVSVTFYTQGCPHRCEGCHNPETWDFNGGKEFTPSTMKEILDAIVANGINRNLCIMGGEPLCDDNLFLVHMLINEVRRHYPEIKVYIWTGYYYEDLLKKNNTRINQILSITDVLIDGPFILSMRDITLHMRGSSNQSIINLKEIDKNS